MRRSVFQAVAVLPSMDWDKNYCLAAQHIPGGCSAAIYGLGEELLPCGTTDFRRLHCCHLYTGIGSVLFCGTASTAFSRSYRSLIMWDAG